MLKIKCDINQQTNGAHDLNEKNPKPYRTISHFLHESAISGGLGQEIRTFRLASVPLPYLTKVLSHHYITMPHWTNLTNKIAMPCHHVHVPAVYSCPNELCDIHCDAHATTSQTEVYILIDLCSVETSVII